MIIRLVKQSLNIFMLALGAYLAYWLIERYLPYQYNPLKPVVINDAPNFLTSLKIELLKYNSDVCFNVLEKSSLEFERIADRDTGDDCGIYNAALLTQSGVSYGEDITLSCSASVALAIWQQHDLQPLAEQIFGQRVIRVHHYGTYSCRNINNSSTGRRSQHAYANAIDIAGFRLADGSEISILNDWGESTDKGIFLAAIHRSACQRFSTVLGPNYNNLHRDHFHFDQGDASICR